MADISLSRPAQGQEFVISPLPDDRLVLHFNPGDALLEKQDNNLVFSFDDGSKIILENFYESYTSENMPEFLVGEYIISGEEFFAANEELMPAAGNAPSSPQGSGTNQGFEMGSLLGGVDAETGLSLVGVGLENWTARELPDGSFVLESDEGLGTLTVAQDGTVTFIPTENVPQEGIERALTLTTQDGDGATEEVAVTLMFSDEGLSIVIPDSTLEDVTLKEADIPEPSGGADTSVGTFASGDLGFETIPDTFAWNLAEAPASIGDEVLEWSLSDDGKTLTAKDVGGVDVFAVVYDGDSTYTVTQFKAIDNGSVDELTEHFALSFSATSGSLSLLGTVQVNLVDSIPVTSSNITGADVENQMSIMGSSENLTVTKEDFIVLMSDSLGKEFTETNTSVKFTDSKTGEFSLDNGITLSSALFEKSGDDWIQDNDAKTTLGWREDASNAYTSGLGIKGISTSSTHEIASNGTQAEGLIISLGGMQTTAITLSLGCFNLYWDDNTPNKIGEEVLVQFYNANGILVNEMTFGGHEGDKANNDGAEFTRTLVTDEVFSEVRLIPTTQNSDFVLTGLEIPKDAIPAIEGQIEFEKDAGQDSIESFAFANIAIGGSDVQGLEALALTAKDGDITLHIGKDGTGYVASDTADDAIFTLTMNQDGQWDVQQHTRLDEQIRIDFATTDVDGSVGTHTVTLEGYAGADATGQHIMAVSDDGIPLFGGAGDDILEGGVGADLLHGGAGDDLLAFDVDDILMDGGDDMDILLAGAGALNEVQDAIEAGKVENVEMVVIGDVVAKNVDDAFEQLEGVEKTDGDSITVDTSKWTENTMSTVGHGFKEFSNDESVTILVQTNNLGT